MNERMREKSEEIQVKSGTGLEPFRPDCISRRGDTGWGHITPAKDPEASIPPGGHFYFPIQSLLVISQEQLKKHKQSFNSLLPEGPSSEFGLVHTHSY